MRRIANSASEGERRVHVEDSWKYAAEDFRSLASGAGYRPVKMWTDEAARFSVHLLEL